MPGDLRSVEFGPYPYYYESRYDHHPHEDSMNEGTAEEWKENSSNEQVRRVMQNLRQKFTESDLNII